MPVKLNLATGRDSGLFSTDEIRPVDKRQHRARVMSSVLWFLVALAVWWSVSTVNCGGAECLPYIIFFYSAFWVPVMIYLAGAEALARALSLRWRVLTYTRAPIYIAFVAVGSWGLVPLVHDSRFGATSQLGMILIPSAAVAVVYLIRSLNLIGVLWRLLVGGLPMAEELMTEIKNLEPERRHFLDQRGDDGSA
jgi:hypothetical protein